MSSLVSFRIGGRRYATDLAAVREVVRLSGLTDLPGMAPPLAGVVDLRGTALPVLDLRPDATGRGDVLVLERPGRPPVGVAVDAVLAVCEAQELPATPGGTGELPGYVRTVLRGAGGPVFLVDLDAMVDAARTAVA